MIEQGGVQRPLTDVEVAITGRLASMTRAEACSRIVEAGGTYVPSPSRTTAWLIVGQGGPPLGEDGRLTHSLREARDLEAAGTGIQILPEQDFVARLGLEQRREDLQRLFTTEQLSRILGVPAARLRSWVRHELIRPVRVVRRLCFFDFPQVACAKALSQLTQTGVTPQRIRRSLEQLGAWLPEAARSLAQLEAIEQGGPLLVRTAEGQLAEPTGQLRLEFGEAEPDVADAQPIALPSIDRDAEAWFEVGIDAEEAERLGDAVQAYERALARGKQDSEVYFNLGNALYGLDRKREAAQRFTQAVEDKPDYVEAWNNLGNVLSELGHGVEAVHAYRAALSIEPDYADAYYNLAETLASQGELAEARRQWLAYLERDPNSSWAREVRTRLSVRKDPGTEP